MFEEEEEGGVSVFGPVRKNLGFRLQLLMSNMK
jgi:hypothetical protein